MRFPISTETKDNFQVVENYLKLLRGAGKNLDPEGKRALSVLSDLVSLQYIKDQSPCNWKTLSLMTRASQLSEGRSHSDLRRRRQIGMLEKLFLDKAGKISNRCFADSIEEFYSLIERKDARLIEKIDSMRDFSCDYLVQSHTIADYNDEEIMCYLELLRDDLFKLECSRATHDGFVNPIEYISRRLYTDAPNRVESLIQLCSSFTENLEDSHDSIEFYDRWRDQVMHKDREEMIKQMRNQASFKVCRRILEMSGDVGQHSEQHRPKKSFSPFRCLPFFR